MRYVPKFQELGRINRVNIIQLLTIEVLDMM